MAEQIRNIRTWGTPRCSQTCLRNKANDKRMEPGLAWSRGGLLETTMTKAPDTSAAPNAASKPAQTKIVVEEHGVEMLRPARRPARFGGTSIIDPSWSWETRVERLSVHLWCASSMNSSAISSTHLKRSAWLTPDADLMGRWVYPFSCEDHREFGGAQPGGVQRVTTLKVAGAKVGLNAEIQRLSLPKPGSAEARLIARVTRLEADLSAVADRFRRMEKGARFRMRHETLGIPASWRRDAEHWQQCYLRTLEMMNAVSALVNRLERGGRQVNVSECEFFYGEDERKDEQDRVHPPLVKASPGWRTEAGLCKDLKGEAQI